MVLALVVESACCAFAAVMFAVVAHIWIGETEVDEDAIVVRVWENRVDCACVPNQRKIRAACEKMVVSTKVFSSALTTFYCIIRTITPTMLFAEIGGCHPELMFVEEWNKPSASVVDARDAESSYNR